jgi:hypothetical protein
MKILFIIPLIIFSVISVAHAQSADFKVLLSGFQNSEPFKEYGFTYKSCQTGQFGNQPVKIQKRAWLPDMAPIDRPCRPDTLYSWGSMKKIEILKQQMGKGEWSEQFSKQLFATFLPVGTFFYGDLPIRIKLKKNLNFKQIGYNDCRLDKRLSNRKIRENQTTVFYDVRALPDGGPVPNGEYLYDFIICSPEVIESWSYGQKEHFDEVIRDLKWITDNANKGSFVSYTQLRNGEPGIDINFEDRPFVRYFTHSKRRTEGQTIDGYEVNEKTLYKNISSFFRIANEGQGDVFFNPNSTISNTIDEHFSTNKKTYFND